MLVVVLMVEHGTETHLLMPLHRKRVNLPTRLMIGRSYWQLHSQERV